MKVVHLSTTDFGGAYKACERINEALNLVGVDSKVLVRDKTRQETDCRSVLDNKIKFFISKTKNFLNLILSNNDIQSDYFGTDITKIQEVKDADVVVLHWVNSFVSYSYVKKLLDTGKPVIWVLHDMWLLTGGCHYDQYCGGYKNGCINCPRSKSLLCNPADNFIRKSKMLIGYDNITLVGVGEWITKVAKESDITASSNIKRIFNPINHNVFHPYDNSDEIKKKYSIPMDKKVVLCGAMQSFSNVQKGFAKLYEALGTYLKKNDHEDIVLVMFGNASDDKWKELSCDIIYTGVIYDETELAYVYSMADVMVVPSQQETFCYTCCEALACGTPVVGFNIGGLEDQVVHKTNGYLAEYGNVDDFSEGMRYCLKNHSKMAMYLKKNVDNRINYIEIGNRYKILLNEW